MARLIDQPHPRGNAGAVCDLRAEARAAVLAESNTYENLKLTRPFLKIEVQHKHEVPM